MGTENKPSAKRGEAAFIFAIIIGLAVGIFIKKVRIGLILGLVLGSLIVFTGWVRSTRR